MNGGRKWSWWREFALGEISLPSSAIVGMQTLLFAHGDISDELTRPVVALTVVALVALINVRYAQLSRELEMLRSERSSAATNE